MRRITGFIVRGAAVLAAAALVLLAVWAAVAGPSTVLRIVRYGDTRIDDFTHDPGRTIEPSPSPLVLERADRELRVPAEALPVGSSTLDELLEARDSLAFLVLHDRKILYERYYQGHSADSLSQLFSVTKSVTSALVGAAIEDGYMEGVDEPITTFVPELARSGFDRVTLHYLLTMTSGSAYVENDNPFGEHVILNYTPRLEQRILEFEMDAEPGAVFRYKSGDNALLGLALSRVLEGETISQYAERRLWRPSGMQDGAVWTLDREADGLERTWCCLAASARDMLKFGLLYLEGGSLNGRTILSAEWVELSTGVGHVPKDIWPDDYRSIGWRNYGYQWWLASESEGDFFGLGKDGQFVYVNPTDGVVIVRLGWSQGGLRGSEWIALFQAISDEVKSSENSWRPGAKAAWAGEGVSPAEAHPGFGTRLGYHRYRSRSAARSATPSLRRSANQCPNAFSVRSSKERFRAIEFTRTTSAWRSSTSSRSTAVTPSWSPNSMPQA